MESESNHNLQTSAIEWHIRLRDGDEAVWDAFTEWLAQDPRHLEAYESIEQMDLAMEPLLPEVVFSGSAHRADEQPRAPVLQSRRWLAGAALAACIAALAFFLFPYVTGSRYEIATGAGQRQVVALDSDTQVILNGSTRVIFDRKNPRFAALASGEALFRVHHDEKHPFTLEIGNNRIQDVGTVFNVVRDAGELRVTVAEGKVIYSNQTRTVPLEAGQALLASIDSSGLRVSSVPTSSVGAWQHSRLVYSGEPLSQVAADLGRSLGVNIVVSPSLQDRPFSGVIVLNGAGPEQVGRLGAALGVDLQSGSSGWKMNPIDNGRR